MLTKKQLDIRKTGLGGSDIAPILGISPWRTALSVYLEKIGFEEPEQTHSDAVHFGNLLEDVIAREYSRREDIKVLEEPNTLRHKKYDFMIANIDRWVGDKEFVLECKTAGAFRQNEWGAPGSDQIPEQYLTQAAWYASVCDVPKVDIAVLIGGQDFRIYTYHRNIEFENKLIMFAYKFWHENVLAQTPPSSTTLDDIKSIYSEDNGKAIEATYEIQQKVQQLKEFKKQQNSLVGQINMLQLEIQEYMKDNAVLTQDDGSAIATWKSMNSRTVFDLSTFKEDHKMLFKRYSKPSKNSRTFLIK